MLLDRIEISLVLVTNGDIHVGSGHQIQRPDTEEGEIACCVRHAGGRTHVPGTSLKGALRASLKRNGRSALSEERLGTAMLHEASQGRIGSIWIDGATAIDEPGPSLQGLDTQPDVCAEGVFIKGQTRIARARGAAERHLLYFSERVPSGTRFCCRITGFCDDLARQSQKLIEDLAGIVAQLGETEGLPIGRGAARGHSSLLRESWRLEARRLTPFAELERDTEMEADLVKRFDDGLRQYAPGVSTWKRLRLTCDGPFISLGPPTEELDGEGQTRRVTTPLKRNREPVLWPSSLLGALRARAAWLAELARIRNPQHCLFAPGRPAELTMDDRSLEQALGGRRSVQDRRDVERLSSVERLFGVPGWRGLVVVGDVVFRGPLRGWPCLQQVSIDRFSGGARQGPLFKTETALDPVFEVAYRLEEHQALTDTDRQLFDQLIEDVAPADRSAAVEPLYLGHGSSKGFGWFTAERLE